MPIPEIPDKIYDLLCCFLFAIAWIMTFIILYNSDKRK